MQSQNKGHIVYMQQHIANGHQGDPNDRGKGQNQHAHQTALAQYHSQTQGTNTNMFTSLSGGMMQHHQGHGGSNGFYNSSQITPHQQQMMNTYQHQMIRGNNGMGQVGIQSEQTGPMGLKLQS